MKNGLVKRVGLRGLEPLTSTLPGRHDRAHGGSPQFQKPCEQRIDTAANDRERGQLQPPKAESSPGSNGADRCPPAVGRGFARVRLRSSAQVKRHTEEQRSEADGAERAPMVVKMVVKS
jgi:hypothetical protein